MRLLLSLTIAAFVLLPAPTTLRYDFRPGQVQKMLVEDTIVSSLQIGTQPAVIMSKQTTTLSVQRKTLSFANGKAVIEVTPLEGKTEILTAQTRTTRMVEQIVRLYTYTAQGKELKTERKMPPGLQDPGPQPLEGLSFSLTTKPVDVGATWSESTSTRGMDGKPMLVRSNSIFVRKVTRLNHPCAEIQVTFNGKSRTPATDKSPAVDTLLTGKVLYCHTLDTGQDVEATSDIKIVSTAQVKNGDKLQPLVRTLQYNSKQTQQK